MYKNNSMDNIFIQPTGSGVSTVTNITLNFGTETKEQLVERLIKEGKISLKEGMILMDHTPQQPVAPYIPYVPYAPLTPNVPYEPWTQPWTQPWSPLYPTITYSSHENGIGGIFCNSIGQA